MYSTRPGSYYTVDFLSGNRKLCGKWTVVVHRCIECRALNSQQTIKLYTGKMRLSRAEKLIFPLFLFIFEVVFLILYGLLVRYDDAGAPHGDVALAAAAEHQGTSDEFLRALQSSLSTTKTYPCELYSTIGHKNYV